MTLFAGVGPKMDIVVAHIAILRTYLPTARLTIIIVIVILTFFFFFLSPSPLFNYGTNRLRQPGENKKTDRKFSFAIDFCKDFSINPAPLVDEGGGMRGNV